MLTAPTIIVDNYDSFTWNIVHLLQSLGDQPVVIRNDARCSDEILRMRPSRVLLSPGPGTPKDAGVSNELLKRLPHEVPVLGVCLGHQVIGAHFDVPVIRAPVPRHGQVSLIRHNNKCLLAGLPLTFEATRYHSLVLQESALPDHLSAVAWTEDDGNRLLMGISHKHRPLFGVQFHPESFLTHHGRVFMENFLKWTSPALLPNG